MSSSRCTTKIALMLLCRSENTYWVLVSSEPAIVHHRLRRGLAQFELGAHFPQAGSKRCNLFLQLFNRALFFYKRFMLFEKLVEQHRVHLLVAHAVGLSFFIAHHKIRIHLLHILSD